MDAEASSGSSTVTGLLLLCGFLAFDGLTSVMEEKLFKDAIETWGLSCMCCERRRMSRNVTEPQPFRAVQDYETSKWNQILYVNLLSSTTSAAALVQHLAVVRCLLLRCMDFYFNGGSSSFAHAFAYACRSELVR